MTTPLSLPRRLCRVPHRAGNRLRVVSAGLLCASLGATAWAHHPMDGAVPESAWHGWLSGLAHPVIGLDHLVFMVVAALLAAWAGWRATGPAVLFAGTGLLGVLARANGMNLPWAEAALAFSLLGLAIMLLARAYPRTWVAVAGATFAGLVHGLAFGEAVVGAETTPLLAYLGGLATVQVLLLVGVHRVGQQLARALPGAVALAHRIAGAAAAVAGLATLWLALPTMAA